MPTVPKLNRVDSQQRISETALPSVRANPNQPVEAFGGGAENIVSTQEKLTNVATKIIEQETERADDVVLIDAKIRTSELRNNLFYDPKNGAFTKKGKDAFGISETYGQDFDKGIEEIEKGLNNRQKVLFSKIKASERMELMGNLERHTFSESQAFEKETYHAGIIAARNDMTLNWQNIGKIPEGVLSIRENAFKLAKMQGMDESTTKLYVNTEVSKGHRAVIERMLANEQDLLAKQYRDFVGEALLGDDRTKVDHVLREGSTIGEAKRNADKIINQFPEDQESAMQKLQEDVKDAKVYEKTRLMVNNYFSDKEGIDRKIREKRFKTASYIVETTKQLPPPTITAYLTPSENTALERRLEQLHKGVSPETNWGLYYDLKNMATVEQDKTDFINLNLMKYRSYLNDPEFKDLVNLQESIRRNDIENISGNISEYRTNYKIENSALDSIGIDFGAHPGTEEYQSVAQFRRAVDEQISIEKKRIGKQFIPNEDVQKIIDNILINNVRFRPTYWGFGKEAYFDFGNDIKQEEQALSEKADVGAATYIKDVPLEESQKITDALTRAGHSVIDEKIIELYNRKMSELVQ